MGRPKHLVKRTAKEKSRQAVVVLLLLVVAGALLMGILHVI